jgi:SAM-dependent methyltransferase
MSFHCNLCGASGLEKIHALDTASITQQRTAHIQETALWFCTACGHTITEPLKNVEDYYSLQYNFLTGSEDEDHLLKVVGEEKIFRSDYQADILSQAVDLQPGMRILDFGCAKAATLKKLLQRLAIVPFVFDVSDMYQPFWNTFVPAQNQATHTIPEPWRGTMDVVCSFFCLEHVVDPVAILRTKFELLKEGGSCYFVVPNFHTNIADLLVLEHVNHFAPCSLRYALEKAGFSGIAIDGAAQPGWIMVKAVRKNSHSAPAFPPRVEVDAAAHISRATAHYWQQTTRKLKDFRADSGKPIAIYGAGFYGTYAAFHLNPAVTVACFVDQNSFLQGTTYLEKPVLAPAQLPEGITQLLVALNPAYAKATVAAMDMWKGRGLHYEFIF